MRRLRRVICLIVVLIISYAMVNESYAVTSFSSITSESIRDKQNQISNAEDFKKSLQSGLTDAKAIKKQLEALRSDLKAYITRIDQELTAIEEKIEEYKQMIIVKEGEITQITAELDEALEIERVQYESMKARIKFIYEKGDTFYIELMLNAKSFGDLLTKADFIEKLSAYDRKMLDEYTQNREWIELCKATLEAEKQALDEAKAAQEADEAALQELLDQKNQELTNYANDIAGKEKQIRDYEEELEMQTTLIEQLEAQIIEEKKQIAAQNGLILTYDGGKFQWPAPSYTRVTDDFGWRVDPLNGSSSYHSGIDLGAPAGSPILAAYDGVVIAADYNYSMGNYIMINHGDGLYTVYMHASKLYVNANDIVVRGESIAAVGSTGRSTGNHLHFSVRLNGTYVNPWTYFQ